VAIQGYCVNGPAIVSVKISSAYVTLGYTQDGVDLRLMQHLEEIITDVFGPRVPQDLQDMMMDAHIGIPFIAIDRTDLITVLNVGDKTTNIDGTSNSPGLVLGAGGYGQVLGIASQFDSPWFFYQTFVRDDKWRTKLATKANPVNINFYAMPKASYTVTAGMGTQLYSRASI
jgi:hypothetical protein